MGQAQGKEFPYSAVEQLSTSPNGLWSFHSGTQKDGSPVGIFQFNQASDKPMGKIRADNAIKKSKIMRHPNILRFVDSISLETQDLMVMEEAIPLSAVLSEIVSHPDWIAYGLKQIADALCFLNTQCNMVHGNVCISSVFVTPAGEWKLSGLELLSEQGSSHLLASNQQSIPTILPLPIPPECKSTNWKGPNAAFDAYQFAVLIYQVFNPQSDTKNISTKNIPKSLLASFQQLIDENPRKRPSIKDVVTGPFFCNALTSACDFIDNISLKEAPEKEIFLKKLTSQIDGFPERICKLKILPALMTALDFGSASSQVIGPILKIGKLLSAEEYTEQIAPNVAKWFSSPDKTLRVNLLQNLSSFAEFLTPALVNEKIFPNIVGGFIDPNPAMRELTIISIVHLVPKIDKKSLDGTLLKALAKMQVDREPGIRANATICLSKISSHLPPESRKRSLIPGFSRALQDPFVHTRSAGVMAFAATQQYYDKEDIAKRIIPALSVCCIDPQEKVRKNALNTIKSFVSKLEFISENPGEDVTSKESAGMFSWAVSSLSKFYPSKTVETKVENDTENKQKQPEKSVSTSSINTTQALNDDIEDPYESPQENLEADGWDDEDDWGDFEAVTPNKLELAKVKKETKKVAKKETTKPKEPTKPKETHVAPIVEDGWNDDGGWEDFDEAELNEQEPEAPAIDAEGGWGNDGWDDEDDWGDFNSKTPSKLDVAKQKKQKSAKSD